MIIYRLALLFTFITAALSAAIPPVPPTQDPFYTPPPGYESKYKVGEIIAHRPVPGVLASLILPQKVKNAWQLLVRSEDSLGNPNAIVTTLIQPFNAKPDKLLSFQIAQDTVFLDCAPSYQIQVGVLPDTTAQPEMILIIAALDKGWYVVTPDYEGPKSAFTAGHQEGKATLNSIRAVLKSGSFTGINSNPTISLWGYSGGTIATGWAVNLAPKYAPDLKFVGAAMGGVVPNLTAIVEYLSGTLFAGFGLNGIVGLTQDFPELNTLVNQEILPAHKWRIDYVKKVCLGEVLLSQAFLNIWSSVKSGIKVLWNPKLQPILKLHDMAREDSLPNTPIFMYHAINDEIAPVAPVETLYSNWCSRGVSVNFQVDQTGGHITEAVIGAGKALVWLQDRMNGVKVSSTCNRSVNFSNALDPRAIFALGGIVVTALRAFLQHPVGMGDKIDLMALVG